MACFVMRYIYMEVKVTAHGIDAMAWYTVYGMVYYKMWYGTWWHGIWHCLYMVLYMVWYCMGWYVDGMLYVVWCKQCALYICIYVQT